MTSTKKGKKPDGMTLEERATRAETERLRAVAHSSTLSVDPAVASKQIPPALVDFHGADILKKNTPKKMKYLMSLPGAVSIPAGGKLGDLHDLDTTTPTLTIQYDTFCITFRGVLIHPKNTFLAIRTRAGRKKSALIQDVFTSLLAFTEWSVDHPDELDKRLAQEQHSQRIWKSNDQDIPVEYIEEPTNDREEKPVPKLDESDAGVNTQQTKEDDDEMTQETMQDADAKDVNTDAKGVDDTKVEGNDTKVKGSDTKVKSSDNTNDDDNDNDDEGEGGSQRRRSTRTRTPTKKYTVPNPTSKNDDDDIDDDDDDDDDAMDVEDDDDDEDEEEVFKP